MGMRTYQMNLTICVHSLYPSYLRSVEDDLSMTDLQDHYLLLHSVSAGSDNGDQGEGEPQLSQKEAPMFLKDYERKRLLERGTLALVSDSEEEEEEGEGLEREKKVGT